MLCYDRREPNLDKGGELSLAAFFLFACLREAEVPGKKHNDQTKAAVLAALLAGQSISEVSRQFHVERTTIRAWRRAAGLTDDQPLVNQEKKSELGDLIAEYLRENLTTLAAQTRFFRNEEWLKGQSAADLAVLHGVSADKAIRILSALEPVEIGEPAGDAE